MNKRDSLCKALSKHLKLKEKEGKKMTIFKKFNEAFNSGDVEKVAECFHTDIQMTMHSDGSVMNKKEWIERVGPMMGKLKREKVRCIYENEDILVTHFFGTFPNGSQDAIMWVGLKKDGLIFRVETGSTPINLS